MPVHLGDILAYIFLFLGVYFEVFLLLTFMQGRSAMAKDAEACQELATYPSVTVIVPCWNEEKTIDATVQSILALDYPKDKLFITLVDDGSTDNTWNFIQSYKDNPQIHVYQKENGGKYTALNYGIERATTDLVGCLDADSFVSTDALKRIAPKFANPNVMVVTPAIRIFKPQTVLQHLQHIEYNTGILLRKMFALLGAVHVTPGPFSIFRRSVFEKIGYFRHAHNTEDMEMALRLHSHNFKIENAHNAYVFTVGPRGLKALYKQRVRWTHGFLENALDYKYLFFNRKYGNVGFLTLPFGVISIIGFTIMMGFTLSNIIFTIKEKYIKFSTIGFDPQFHGWSFSWFYINTQTVALLGVFAFFLTITFMLMAKRMVGDKSFLSRDMIFYIILYPIITPLWLVKSVYNTAFSRKSSWR